MKEFLKAEMNKVLRKCCKTQTNNGGKQNKTKKNCSKSEY